MDTGLDCHFLSWPADLPDAGIEPVKSVVSAALAGGFFSSSATCWNRGESEI